MEVPGYIYLRLVLAILAILGGIGVESSFSVQAKTDIYKNRQSPISQLRLAVTTNTPNIAKNTTRLIFNDVQGGAASAAQTVTLRNTGNTKLTISNLRLSGTNANQFQIAQKPTLPLTLAAGSVAKVSVAFKPTTQGPKGDLLQIQSNDPDTPLTTVSLRGLGTKGLGGGKRALAPVDSRYLSNSYLRRGPRRHR